MCYGHAGIGLSDSHLLLSSISAAELYDLTAAPPQLALAFTFHHGPSPILQGHLLYRAEGTSVQICNMAGTVQQTLTVAEVRGAAEKCWWLSLLALLQHTKYHRLHQNRCLHTWKVARHAKCLRVPSLMSAYNVPGGTQYYRAGTPSFLHFTSSLDKPGEAWFCRHALCILAHGRPCICSLSCRMMSQSASLRAASGVKWVYIAFHY